MLTKGYIRYHHPCVMHCSDGFVYTVRHQALYLNEIGRMFSQFGEAHTAAKYYLAAQDLMGTSKDYSPGPALTDPNYMALQAHVLIASALDCGYVYCELLSHERKYGRIFQTK